MRLWSTLTTRIGLIGREKLCASLHHLLSPIYTQISTQKITSQNSLTQVVTPINHLRPNLVLLDMVPIEARKREAFTRIGELTIPPEIIAISGDYASLDYAKTRQVTKATLLEGTALSPVLFPVIQGVLEGYVYHDPNPTDFRYPTLNIREQVIIQLMALGCDIECLMRLTGRTENAIHYARKCIRDKLDVTSNEQAIVKAIREGRVSLLNAPNVRAA